MAHGFEVGERVEVVSDDGEYKAGAQGIIVFIKTKFIYVELDEPPPEHLSIILLDPITDQPHILASFAPGQLRHIVTPSA